MVGWYSEPWEDMGEGTKLVHGGVEPDPTTGAINPPIYASTTYIQPSIEGYLSKGYSYSRQGNPTVSALEKKLAILDEGHEAACFSSGMAATCVVLTAFLTPGDICIMSQCTYGGTNRIAKANFSRYNIHFEFMDLRDIEAVKAYAEKSENKGKIRLLFSEVPTNPTLRFCDVDALSEICHAHNIVHCCDSTFATPILFKPLLHGADLTLHSTTKLFDGHNIGVGGTIISKTEELGEKIKYWRNVMGNIMTPQTAFYTLQTIKTLNLRVVQQSLTARKVAEFLSKNAHVDTVMYPSLGYADHPAYVRKIYKREDMCGTMLWFEPKGGQDAARIFMNSIKRPWSLCENLGTTESLITCPAVFTHANMSTKDRHNVGITDAMVRVSVGLEDPQDLISALDQALKETTKPHPTPAKGSPQKRGLDAAVDEKKRQKTDTHVSTMSQTSTKPPTENKQT